MDCHLENLMMLQVLNHHFLEPQIVGKTLYQQETAVLFQKQFHCSTSLFHLLILLSL